ncbi:unnamed protein product [Strongylus vulgaris]|uniref:Uncharacterized protein n=1 Tax=Strongylus vulgaris TaxID=40348 RepID=A0A3P7J310_STRVU|nr:unnamed protein product [Strongylus vulgaris]
MMRWEVSGCRAALGSWANTPGAGMGQSAVCRKPITVRERNNVQEMNHDRLTMTKDHAGFAQINHFGSDLALDSVKIGQMLIGVI